MVVHRAAAIHLGRRLPAASSDLPGGGPGRADASLFGLAPGGACSAGRSPDRWCALTAPSHPYRRRLRTSQPRGVASGWRCVSVRFPSGRPAWELPSALSRGARTFLDAPAEAVAPRPPGGLALPLYRAMVPVPVRPNSLPNDPTGDGSASDDPARRSRARRLAD